MASKEKLLGVQYLRAIAALMVVYYHLTLIPVIAPRLAADTWIDTSYLWRAVPVFFVISGFVMYVSGIRSSPGKFVGRRLARILPLYWCLTLAVAVLALGVPSLLPSTQATREHIIKSLLFLPYFSSPHTTEIFPLLPPGWSLNYEMFFYVVFALTLFVPQRQRLTTMLLVLSGLYVMGAALPSIRSSPIGFTYTSRLLFLFAIGLVLGALYRGGVLKLPKWLAAILVIGGFYALIGTVAPGWVRAEIAPASIVLGAVSLDSVDATPRWPWLLALGDASYSIYLVHPFALDAIDKIWLRLHLHSVGGFVLFALAISIAMALVTYRLIERPALALVSGKQIRAETLQSAPQPESPTNQKTTVPPPFPLSPASGASRP